MFAFLFSLSHSNIVYSLDSTNATQYIEGKDPVVIKFYSPDCPYCMELAPHFNKAASLFNNVKFAQINCIANEDLCDSLGVFQYPQVQVRMINMQPANYQGELEADPIIDFIEMKTGRIAKRYRPYIQLLTPYNFDKNVNPKRYSMILFSTPDGSAINSSFYTIRELAQIYRYEDDITIGRIDCESYSAFCKQKNIEKDPTIIEYNHGEESIYDGEIDIDKMLLYINVKLHLHRNRDGLLDESVGLVNDTDVIIQKFFDMSRNSEESQSVIDEMKKIEGANFYVSVMERIEKDGIQKIMEIHERMSDILDVMDESGKVLDSIRPKFNVYSQFIQIYMKNKEDETEENYKEL